MVSSRTVWAISGSMDGTLGNSENGKCFQRGTRCVAHSSLVAQSSRKLRELWVGGADFVKWCVLEWLSALYRHNQIFISTRLDRAAAAHETILLWVRPHDFRLSFPHQLFAVMFIAIFPNVYLCLLSKLFFTIFSSRWLSHSFPFR